jgi:hypothetical protein
MDVLKTTIKKLATNKIQNICILMGGNMIMWFCLFLYLYLMVQLHSAALTFQAVCMTAKLLIGVIFTQS